MGKIIKGSGASFDPTNLCGWAGKKLAKQQNAIYAKSLSPFLIKGGDPNDYKGKKRFLWDCTRKVLGKDTPNYAQKTGDCTSYSAKNILEYLQCTQIVMNGKNETFHNVFPPYFFL